MYRQTIRMVVCTLAALLATGMVWGQVTNVTHPANSPYATIQAAIDDPVTLAGDVIEVSAGTHSLATNVTVNKANLTIQGVGATSTILQVSGTGARITLNTSGATLQNLQIQKTDKAGVQNIIYVGANNVSIKNTIIWGQFVIGDGDVSRAMEVAYGVTGLLVDGNTFYGLRQPGYLNGSLASPTTGTISSNYVYGTKGWVIAGANMTFTGNTWGTNVYDVAILSGTDASYYPSIVAVSAANNDAVIEDQRVSPAVLSVVYVDGSTSFTTDLGGKYHPYATITPAITRVVAGGKIKVAAGTYDEDVNINRTLSLLGSGAGSTTIRGVIGGDNATIRINANNVTVAGFTVTRLGNNTTDWNNSNLNSVGVAVIGTALSGMTIRDNTITGNRTGIDINNSSGHTVRNNVITFNRTGLVLRNQTDNLLIVENEITDNWTVGFVFLDASSGTNSPVQTALNCTISNNNISGNWYGQVVDRQTGGSLPAPGTTNLKNFSGNWFGTTTPVITTAGSTEPGYSDLIPVAYGGTATPPGGQPDIAGTASPNIDYTPLLISGTDTNIETLTGRGTIGFQGDYTTLRVCSGGSQTGSTGRIQEGVNLVSGSTVNVEAGTYPEMVTISKSVNLLGAKAGVDPRGGARTEGAADESIIDGGSSRTEGIFVRGTGESSRVSNVVIDGFEIHHATYANVRFDYANNTTLKNTMIHHSTTNEGIKTKGSCSGLLIQKTISHDNVGDGIELGDYGTHANHTVEDCEFYNNADRGVYLYQVSSPVIRRVKSHHNQGTVGDWHQGGLIAYQCTNTTVTDVESYNNAGVGIYLYKDNYAGTTSSTVGGTSKTFNNTASNVPGDGLAIYLSRNVTVTGLESYANARHGIMAGTMGQYGDLGGSEYCRNVALSSNNSHGNTGSAVAFLGIGTSNCSASANTLDGTGKGLLIQGITTGSSFALGSSTFGSSLSEYIRLTATTLDVDASSATFTGSPSLGQKEAKIYHKYDDASLGLVNYGQLGPQLEVWVDDNWAGTLPGTLVDGHIFGSDAFAVIQDGVDNVMPGGTVHIAAGSYSENVNVPKANLSILGEGYGTTVVNGGGGGMPSCMTLNAAGVKIDGLGFTNAQDGLVILADGARISNCKAYDMARNGMRIENAAYCVVQGSISTHNTLGAGIALVNARQNTIAGNRFDGGNQYNVSITGSGTGTARGNIIQGNTMLDPGVWSVDVNSDPLTTKVNFNAFNGPDKYIRNSTSSVTQKVDATYNWFGGEASPGPGAPDFEGAVDYQFNYATDPTVSVFPISYYMPQSSTVTVNVMAMLPAGTFARGVDVTLNWSAGTPVAPSGAPTEGTFFSGFTKSFYYTNPTATSLRVNTTILGTTSGAGNASPGMPYIRPVFSQLLAAGASDGSNTFTLTGVQLRDPDNNPITPVDVDPPAGALVTVDGTLPSVTPVLIDNTTIDNDNFVKNGDAVDVYATITDANLDAASITANLSGLGGSASASPSSVVGDVYKWTIPSVTCTDGPITVTVNAYDFAGNMGTGSDGITGDNIAPEAPTNLVAKTVSPNGHQKVALSWTAGTDVNLRGVVIRYNGWVFPTYPAGSPPSYPATPGAGTGAGGTVITAPSPYVHEISAQNVYYYSIFAVDWAGNYSTLDGSGTDRSANYYLGDLGSGSGIPLSGSINGQINFEDLGWFSSKYFTSPVSPSRDCELDFGPTVANKSYAVGHRFGIPRPDGIIDFEDLMIFSMNYMNVAPKLAPPADRQLTPQLAVELRSTQTLGEQGKILVATVRLANDGREIKGLTSQLTFDPAMLRLIDVTSGGLFSSQGQELILHREQEGRLTLDAALMGIDRTVNFSGDVAVVRFRELQAGGRVTLQQAIVRNGENKDQEVALKTQVVALPTTFAIEQNYPNPFNPTTNIKYQVPAATHVELVIFNTLGQKVATLVDEVKDAGYYTAEWNGRNNANQQVASGLYFYTFKAAKFSAIKKMLMLK